MEDERVRYVIVGGGTSLLYYGLFTLGWLAWAGPGRYLPLTGAAHVTTALLVYPAYRTFVFRSAAPWVTGFVRFYAVFVSGLVGSLVGLPLLVELASVPVLLAQALVIAVVPVLSYLGHRFWTFRGRDPEPARVKGGPSVGSGPKEDV